MEIFIYLLVLINIIFPVWYTYKSCISKGKVEVNHIMLFSIGYIYYWIIPILTGILGIYSDGGNGLQLWYNIFKNISKDNLIFYLLFSMFFYFFFVMGSMFGNKLTNAPSVEKTYSRIILYIYLIPCILLLLVYAWYFRENLFTGYTTAGSLSMEKGSGVAASLVILSLGFLYDSMKNNTTPSIFNLKRIFSNYFFVIYFIMAILILSMGGRLFFLSSIFMLLVYKSIYFQKINISNLFIGMFLTILLTSVIGILRLGINILDGFQDIFFYITAESLLTSIPLVAFLEDGKLELLNFPIPLINDFINLIPTIILPSKLNLLFDMEKLGYVVYSPMGALNSFVSFMINFGAFGSLIVIIGFGFLLGYLKRNSTNPLYRVYYTMLSGWLVFSFFRSAFYSSIVKSMFEFSILIPGIIYLSIKYLSRLR